MYMETNDKYGIIDAVDKCEQYYSRILRWHDNFRVDFINHIWMDAYNKLDAEKDPHVTIHDLVNLLQLRLQTKLEVEVSCGLFYITKVTLPNGPWYFLRRTDGFYLLPMSKNGNWCYKLHYEVNAMVDLIMEFDRLLPEILCRADKAEVEMTKRMMVREITISTAQGIAASLQKAGKIKMPDNATFTSISDNVVNIRANRKRVECGLDKLEETLLKRFPSGK